MTAIRAWWLVLVVALGFALPAYAEPPIWRVHGGKAEVVLFGSIHLLSPGLNWRTPRLEAEIAKARTLWFETPIDGESRAVVAQAVQRHSLLPAGRSLSALLSAEGRARLGRISANIGVPAAAVDGMRPWFAEVTLTLLHLQRRGAQQAAGVEETLSRSAPPNLPRRAFETAEQQVAILADTPQSQQVASLEQALREMDEEPDAFDQLQKAWLDGDTSWLEREAVEPMRKAAPGLYERLVAARNRRWAAEIERLLKSSEHALIVVGVGHLVGPDSVPALLRRRGIAVEGP